MIGIVDYGSGNINAFINIYKKLNIDTLILNNANSFKKVKKLILPGVGSYDNVITTLKNKNLFDILNKYIIDKRVPVLGVCLGMQIMSNNSDEGKLNGFGWIKGKVKSFEKSKPISKVFYPHMGWNSIELEYDNHPLFLNIDKKQGFYFIHNFFYECDNIKNVLTYTKYGIKFTSSIFHENIFGVQYHPEKSHLNGINLLKNFANLKC